MHSSPSASGSDVDSILEDGAFDGVDAEHEHKGKVGVFGAGVFGDVDISLMDIETMQSLVESDCTFQEVRLGKMKGRDVN
jgi:hypothetical protein